MCYGTESADEARYYVSIDLLGCVDLFVLPSTRALTKDERIILPFFILYPMRRWPLPTLSTRTNMDTISHPQVLFLEDDFDTREMVVVLLRQSDIDVITAETAGEALVLATKNVDAFLLDGMVPNGDSIRLCRTLKARFPGKPIIFYTGLAESADIERAMSAGAAAYLVKPFHGDLGEVIAHWIQEAQYDRVNSATS